MEKKTLSTALGFEPRSFDCRSTASVSNIAILESKIIYFCLWPNFSWLNYLKINWSVTVIQSLIKISKKLLIKLGKHTFKIQISNILLKYLEIDYLFVSLTISLPSSKIVLKTVDLSKVLLIISEFPLIWISRAEFQFTIPIW